MPDVHVIPDLDRKGLREFGLVTGGVLVGLFGLLIPWLFERAYPRWPWLVLSLLAIWSLAAPLSLRPLYRLWMRFGYVLSRITTPLILGGVFFLVITPMGLLRRAFGRDAMARKFDESETYRVPSRQTPANNLKRPF
jgi:Saxitoxin biosynthesis operon protein SxtJ